MGDPFFHYRTDDLYFSNIAHFVKPGGPIWIAGAGLMQEFGDPFPEHLRARWTQDMWCIHSAVWWKRHREQTGIVDVAVTDTLPDSWKFWRD